jgi:hypothetical protein
MRFLFEKVRSAVDMLFVFTDMAVGEIVTDIQKIDPDWWLVKNEAGQVCIGDSEELFDS